MIVIVCFVLLIFLGVWLLKIFQHVLEHGKPHERTAIIKEFTGQIVQMSQQKFASNVIEKCLSFGTPTERQVLVNEMIGSTDDNEPLQVCAWKWIPITSALVCRAILLLVIFSYYILKLQLHIVLIFFFLFFVHVIICFLCMKIVFSLYSFFLT